MIMHEMEDQPEKMFKTIISIDGDSQPKESFFIEAVDGKDADMDEIHNYLHPEDKRPLAIVRTKTRSQNKKKNNLSPIRIDLRTEAEKQYADNYHEDITKRLNSVSIKSKDAEKNKVSPGNSKEDSINIDSDNEDIQPANNNATIGLFEQRYQQLLRTIEENKQQHETEVKKLNRELRELREELYENLDQQQQHEPIFNDDDVEIEEEVEAEQEQVPIIPARKQVICVTGNFAIDHRELGRLIESNGFKYTETVTVSTDYLIACPKNHQSQKVVIATKYAIPIEDSQFLIDLLGVAQDAI